jgi:hypothetical protein
LALLPTGEFIQFCPKVVTINPSLTLNQDDAALLVLVPHLGTFYLPGFNRFW